MISVCGRLIQALKSLLAVAGTNSQRGGSRSIETLYWKHRGNLIAINAVLRSSDIFFSISTRQRNSMQNQPWPYASFLTKSGPIAGQNPPLPTQAIRV